MIATGGTALRSMVWPSAAERGDQFVMDDLDHHLAGRDRLDDGGADRLLADAIGEASDHVERDVGFQQRAAHLAHRGIDIGFRQRAAPRQPIENATKLFRQIVEQCRCPVAALAGAASIDHRHTPRRRGIQYAAAPRFEPSCLWHTGSPAFAGDDDLDVSRRRTPRRSSKHFCARGRIALSGVGLRPQGPGGGSKRTSFREVRGLNARRPRKSRRNWAEMARSRLNALNITFLKRPRRGA